MARFLAVADIHSRTAAIKAICAEAKRHSPDAILVAGDVTSYGDAAEVERVLDRLPGRVLAIPGNRDVPGAFEAGIAKSHAESVVGTRIEIQGVTVAGVPRRPTAPETPCDVLVVHQPPWGILDDPGGGRHIGLREHLDALRRIRPKLLLCGHCHESPGILTEREVMVVNCTLGGGGRGAFVEIDGDHALAWLL